MSVEPEDTPAEEEPENEFMAMLPESVRKQIAETNAREEQERVEARLSGFEAACRRLGKEPPVRAREVVKEPREIETAVGDLPPRARNTDPEESHAAAESVEGLTPSQNAVYDTLRRIGPLTDERLVQFYEGPKQSPSGIRTRRHELVEGGYVRRTGETVISTGRKASLWGVVAREETERGTQAA
jgi:hypothetical protein